MMMRNAMCNSLAVMVACAGLAMSSLALAQGSQPVPSNPPKNQDRNQDRNMDRKDPNRRMDKDRAGDRAGDRHMKEVKVRGPLSYFDDVNGATVRGSNGESVGTVEDVIFDRHSGEIAAYVVNAAGLNWGNDSRLLFPNELRPMTIDDGSVVFNVSVANTESLRSRLAFDKDAFSTATGQNAASTTWWSQFANESDRSYNRADYYNEIYDDMNRNHNNPNGNTDRNRTGAGAGNDHRDSTPQGGNVNGSNPSTPGGDTATGNNSNRDGTRTRTGDQPRTGGDAMKPVPGADSNVNPQTGGHAGPRTGGDKPHMDSNYTTWPYGRETFTKGSKPVQMRGTVSSTERMYGEGNSYYTILHLRDDQGNEKRIVLGPSWYLADQETMPMRGDNVTVTAAEIEPINGTGYAASSMEIQGRKRVELRKGDNYQPTWVGATGATNTDGRRRSLLLASALMGDDVKCRSESSGEVENLVIDLGTSRVLALVIDPNENFLGVADTSRMIPVSVVSPSADDMIYVDATKEMILNAPQAPDRLNANMDWNLDRAYDQNPIGYYSTSADR